MYQSLQKLWKILKDFFQYNYACILGKPRYPKKILPKTTYQPTLSIDEIAKQFDLYIVRRADFHCDEVLNEAGILKDEVISKSDVKGLSMNLLGGLFCQKHAKFRAVKKAADPWNYKAIYLSDYLNDYSVKDVWCPLVYQLQDLHDVAIPALNQKNKDTEKYIKANNLTPELIDNEYKLEYRMKIIHEPVYLNYWHVELKLYDAAGKEVTKKVTNQWAKSSINY